MYNLSYYLHCIIYHLYLSHIYYMLFLYNHFSQCRHIFVVIFIYTYISKCILLSPYNFTMYAHFHGLLFGTGQPFDVFFLDQAISSDCSQLYSVSCSSLCKFEVLKALLGGSLEYIYLILLAIYLSESIFDILYVT